MGKKHSEKKIGKMANVLWFVIHAVVICFRFAAADYVLWSIRTVMYASVNLIIIYPCMVLLFCQLFMYEIVQNGGDL